MKICIIEDNKSISDVLALYLDEHTIIRALTEEDLEPALKTKPDVVFLDPNLPHDITPLYEKLRKKYAIKKTILMSASAFSDSLMNTYHYELLLKKPFSFYEVDLCLKET